MNSKNKFFSLCLALTVSVFGFSVRAVARTGAAPDFEQRLRQMTAKGEISSAEAELYRLYRVTAADRLPPSLRGERPAARNAFQSLGREPSVSFQLRCGFPTIRRVRAALSQMPPDIRMRAEEYLNPERRFNERSLNRLGWPVHLASTLKTDHFQIEWGDTLTNEDGSSPAKDNNQDGVPDVVEAWADYFETSFNQIVNSMNFNPAELDPDAGNKVQIFIGHSDSRSSIDIIGDAYGYTSFSPGTPMPYIVVNNNFTGIPRNDAGPDYIHGAMKATAAHEFFHIIHYLWEPASWDSAEDDWWYEASATWIEDEVYDSINDYHNYFGKDGWATYVEQGLQSSSTMDPISRVYGTAIFGKYLSEHVDGQESIRNLWEIIRPSPGSGMRILHALDFYAQSMGFESLEELYLGYAAANATMDYEEGDKYGSVPLRNSSDDVLPAYLGSTYFYKTGMGGAKRLDLVASPYMSGNVPWGLSLAVRKADGHVLALGNIGVGGTARISAADLGATDVLYFAASFLSETGKAVGNSFFGPNEMNPDVQPPAAVTGIQHAVQPGGFDLAWTLPGDVDLAGCVVSWSNDAGSSGSRTLFGPIEYVEVRGLPAGTYDVSVFAYDQSGNEGSAASIADLNVETAQDPDPPNFESTLWHIPTYGDIDYGGGGGGGNGSACFLKQLGLFGGN